MSLHLPPFHLFTPFFVCPSGILSIFSFFSFTFCLSMKHEAGRRTQDTGRKMQDFKRGKTHHTMIQRIY
ncbi:hypothetical protein L228DRAFT_246825 [Xylona heveae TC161]|uniref:Uncharacterized protein n=1 Tax=Xylona heveae (strain CBS 132557 / TC161) TaxID=1328760 RepID=A0A165GRR9_XYLHT|nr:hypothetical protein L228DRAFT_246825 [Xylona heveae TC161]KZF22513.1 hypothetical protein L228DRAFT_246825 [Xylona heveae TC161]